MAEATKRYAVVTGANKGIGYETVRQLASNGIIVVLTARDEKRGLEAVEKLKHSGFDSVIFHQLDVADPATIHSLADFVRSQFGKLDILLESRSIGLCGTSAIVTGSNDKTTMLIVLADDKHPSTVKCDIREQAQVNNAAIFGVSVDGDALSGFVKDGEPIKWNEIVTPTYELAEKCLWTNYYGSKRMCEVLIPLLRLSDLPRIVNVSSNMGKLKTVSNEWAKGVFSDVENLTEERVDEVLSQYLNDYKEGSLETKGWPANAAAYILSKAAINAYTRILAKKHPNFCINCVCPGYVKTDMTYNTGKLTAEEGAETPVWLALLPKGGPSEGSPDKEGWPASISLRCVKLKSSFECLNKDYGQTHKLQPPSFLDELCLVKTDITCVAGLVTAAEEVKSPVKLAHSLNMKASQLKERIRMRRLNKIKDGGPYLTPHGVTEDSVDFL